MGQQWSKTKKRIADLLHPSVKNLIDIHYTRYHASHDDESAEGRVTVDRETIFTAANVRYEVLLYDELREYMKNRDQNDWKT